MDKGLEHVLGTLLKVVGGERVDDSEKVNCRRHLHVGTVAGKDATVELFKLVFRLGAT